jgi:hypothetical protein
VQEEFAMRVQGIGVYMAAVLAAAAMVAAPLAAAAQSGGTVLTRNDTQKLLPDKVYYKGMSATIQLRNSGGVKFADGYYMLATLVDTSGYSSDIQTKYQAYFITEVPLKIGGQDLAAGVYGVGFVGGKFIVTDVGAHDLLTVPSSQDTEMKRPTPLQVTGDPGGGFRFYCGRSYVSFSR